MKLVDFEFRISNFDKENGDVSLHFRCLLAHFFKYFKRQDAPNVKKINIQLEPEDSNFYSNPEQPVPLYENTLGIVLYRCTFDFEKYRGLSGVDRKRYVFSEFIRRLKEACEKEGVAPAFLDDIYRKVEEDDFINQGYWKKRFLQNPSKTVKAKVFYKYLVDVAEIYAEVVSGKNDPEMILIREISPPYTHEFYGAFGSVEWASDSELVMKDKSGKEYAINCF